MKRIISLCLLLLAIMAAQAQDTRYKLTLNVPANGTLQANAYGTSIYDRRMEYAPGEEVHLTGSLRSEYSCTGWTDEQGTLVCDSLRYTFTMPARDITLTGHTEYNPENPPGPREDGYTDTWNRLYLRSNPSYGGAFTWGLNAESEQNWLVWTGYEFTVQAYPATGFKFVGWQFDDEIVSTDNPYTFTMPERDMTLYAMYEYDPETPANPHANVWDKESGELIVSDFVSGHLYEKIGDVTRRDPWHSDWNLIKSATIAGPSTDERLTYDYPIDIYAFTGNASNVAYLDYSRTSGITKVPDGCFSISTLGQVVLPATIEVIGNYAFRNCTHLTEVTCFATTPPVFDGRMPDDQGYSTNNYYNNWAFDGLKLDDIIIHVPAEAVPLYQAARGWKEFMILPITQQVSRITVSLPQAETYKNMFLELVNTKTLQSQRYVITNSSTYTFNNVIHGTSHHLYIKNARGDIMGRIENIDVTDHDVQVSFDGLKAPCNVELRLLTPDGTDVTSHATITWTDRQGNFLKTGSTISGQVEGTQIRYHVKLDENLGKQYMAPGDSLFTVGSSPVINWQLSVMPQLTISGIVSSESTGSPLRAATVAVSQLLNNAYTVTQTAKTDVNGHYELTVYDAPTTITVTHSNYLKASHATDSLSLPVERAGIDFALRDLTGTIIDLDLYYRPAVHDDEESISRTFDSPGSVNYTVYDETHQRDITNFSEQYPLLVLTDQELDEGTQLRVTATSKTESFMPVTATCAVNGSGRATAIIGITELGRIEASFETTDNMSAMGLLYDGEGQLKGWSGYNDTQLNIFNLPDGHYTLVTMGSNNLFNACNTFSALEQTGVLEHNAVVNELTLTSGHIVVVQNQSIPLFDEDAFRMTSDAATLSVNKSEVTVGQYVTLRASVAFKPAYASQTDVKLLFDLPDGCTLVENSVMVGNGTAAYQTDGSRVIVPLANVSDEVRFCVVPTRGGGYLVSASVATGHAAAAQPFGTALFSAADLTINAVEKTARRSIPVTGMAVPLSLVQVYDNGTLIGETTSLGTGYWSLMCPLDKAYNLSEHSIYAVVTTSEGLQIQSETKTVKVDRAGLTPVVSCRLQSDTFEHKHFDFKWDFRTNEVTPTFAPLTTSAFNDCQQTFEVNFYDENDMVANDTTVIRDVTLYVKTSRGDIRTYPLNYSLRHKSWWIHLDWKDRLPVNVDLDYTVASDLAFDRQEFDDRMQEYVDFLEEGRQHMRDVYHMFDDDGESLKDQATFDELGTLLEQDSLDSKASQRAYELVRQIVGDSIMNEAEKEFAYDHSEIDQLLAKEKLTTEELDRLDSLVNARADWLDAHPIEIMSADSLQAVLAELQQSMNAMFEEVRDSMLLASAMFYGTDTISIKLPDGNASFVIQASNGKYERIDISILTSIDHEQLVSEGYEVIPTTDGTPFYYLQANDGYKLIDAKAMKMYAMTLVDEAEANTLRRAEKGSWWAALANISISMFFPHECNRTFGDLVQHGTKAFDQLRHSTDVISFLENLTTNAIPILQDVEKILACLYDNGRASFDLKLKEILSKAKTQAKVTLDNAKKNRNKVNKDLANWQAQEKEIQKTIDELNFEKAIQKSNKMDFKPGSPEWIKCENKIQSAELRIKTQNSRLKNLNEAIKNHPKMLKDAERTLARAEKGLEKCLGKQKCILRIIEHFPIKLLPDKKIMGTIPKPWFAMPLAGTLLKCFPVCCVAADNLMDSGLWVELSRAIESVMPCEGDAEKAAKLQADKNSKMMLHLGLNLFQFGLDIASLLTESTATFSPMWFVAKAMDVASCVIAVFHPEASQKDRNALEQRLWELDCTPDKDEDDTDSGKPTSGTLDDGDSNSSSSSSRTSRRNFKFKNVYYVFDPSGYVYEAVSSNRIEGVQTTCYYKDKREDMYGDIYEEAVVWDAAQYAQENPLFTDADGRYQWDVPQGLWQVKYEKEGYETTYSDWLPVPPPQLEVNVGITQYRQPNVQKVKAFTDGIDITFDKYMDPQTLTTENILLTAGGQQVNGAIELLNAEAGYQNPDVVYASKIRFKVNGHLNAGSQVQLTVRRAVKSYAGIPMEQDYTQQFDVEKRIASLTVDSVVNMTEDRELTLQVRALPATTAKGRKLAVNNSDSDVVTTAVSELTLDENGEARLTIRSQAQGSSIIRFTLTDDDELTTTTLINVRDSANMQVAAPKASRLNGITLYKGSEIRLTTSTANATILYTLNGSCPCDVGSKSVYTYDAPIIMTGDSMVIKAMAVANGMVDSEVVEYRYKGIDRPTDVEVIRQQGSEQNVPVAYYRLDGRRTEQPQRGLNIMRHRDGSVTKVVIK